MSRCDVIWQSLILAPQLSTSLMTTSSVQRPQSSQVFCPTIQKTSFTKQNEIIGYLIVQKAQAGLWPLRTGFGCQF